ncbi:transferase hexapeptide domain-containing protein [Microdochium bolleyi]|uniref:Dynactin subunit 6 n=1 Tax=Microdochium bolleyi TaxID=196109 RepID=A0A136ITZ3_9PEZI|nr:transferase hexapeptide domain-containing protein [Microdochium bolleyi]
MASSGSKRQSVLPRAPAGPKAPVNFSSSLIIADSAVLLGHHTINISSESVVHPRAKLDSSNGRITIGRRCIVHERTLLGAPSEDTTPIDSRDGVVLGDYITVDVGAVVESGGTTIGESSFIGVGCRVGRGARLGKYCTLTPRSTVPPGERIPDFTVVFSNGSRRQDSRRVAELQHKTQARQIDVLRRLIPSNPAKFQ